MTSSQLKKGLPMCTRGQWALHTYSTVDGWVIVTLQYSLTKMRHRCCVGGILHFEPLPFLPSSNKSNAAPPTTTSQRIEASMMMPIDSLRPLPFANLLWGVLFLSCNLLCPCGWRIGYVVLFAGLCMFPQLPLFWSIIKQRT